MGRTEGENQNFMSPALTPNPGSIIEKGNERLGLNPTERVTQNKERHQFPYDQVSLLDQKNSEQEADVKRRRRIEI